MSKADKAPRRALAIGSTALATVDRIVERKINRHFGMTVNGLVVHGKPTYAACEEAADDIGISERGVQFALGDLVNVAEDALGEAAAQIIDAERWAEKTVAQYAWLAKRVHPQRRRMDRLGVRHHMLVAALPPSEQEKWLTKAAAADEDKPWTVAKLKAAIEAGVEVPTEFFAIVGPFKSGSALDVFMETAAAQGLGCRSVERRKKAEKKAAA